MDPSDRTSLHRSLLEPPRLGVHLVERPRLLGLLDAARGLPLTLVCAPAGYGKSTLVAAWAAASDLPCAWLSVDESHRDPALLLQYLVAAVRTVLPQACRRTWERLELPDVRLAAAADLLASELAELDEEVVLVLDDLHLAGGEAVRAALEPLLGRPPRRLRLVIIARFDPALPLGSLRARGQVAEMRERDLRFTAPEIRAFFDQALGRPLDRTATARLGEATEGWAVGLRLAALLLRERGDVADLLVGMTGGFAEVEDYLVSEVLARQPAELQECLVKSSVVERFSAPLCDALFAPSGEETPAAPSGAAFVDWLIANGLFVIALDARDEWFRYHHLFRELLGQRLARRLPPGEIAALRLRAGGWLEERGHLDEALALYLEAGDRGRAADLVKRHRHELMNREEWSRLDRWLRRLAEEDVRDDVELLVLEAWIFENRYRYREMIETLDRIDELVAAGPAGGTSEELRGELDALRSARAYFAGDGAAAAELARRALEALPADRLSARGFALGVRLLGLQMIGELERARSVAYDALDDRSRRGSTYHGRILIGLCMIEWIEGNAARVGRAAAELLAVGEEFGRPESVAFARYFLGISALDRGDLEAAEAALAPVVEERLPPNTTNFVHSAFALALASLARGAPGRAADLAARVAALALELQHSDLLALAEAFEAELALRRGRLDEALHWARSFRPEVGGPRFRYYVPELTQARVFLAADTDSTRECCNALLRRLREAFSRIHHPRLLVEVFALSALLEEQRGEEQAALGALRRALELASPRGLVRPLADVACLGSAAAGLLRRLEPLGADGSFAREVLASAAATPAPGTTAQLPSPISSTADEALMEPLSDRELEILGLLARRLSNKEIAARLFISPATVKRHNTNIFEKLQVRRRREAVEKARALGILGRA